MKPRVLAFALVPLATACEDLATSPLFNVRVADEIPVEIIGMTLHSHTGRRLDQTVRAERAHLYQGSQRAVLEKFSLDFFGPEGGEPVSTIEADHGEIDLETNTFVAEARDQLIRITRADEGRVLYTRDFHYDPDKGELFTENRFILLSRQHDDSLHEMRGQELRTDRGLNWVQFKAMRQRGLGRIDLQEYEREIRPLKREAAP